GFALRFMRIALAAPRFTTVVLPATFSWGMLSVLVLLLLVILKAIPRGEPGFSPARRRVLTAIRTAAIAAPAGALGYGVLIDRTRIEMHEQTIPIAGLDPELDGLRLVQLSDIHLSPFLSVRELERAVAMANETRAHLALVTGDLISMRGDPLDACLDRLKGLRAEAGIFGCLGNHEVYAGVEDYVAEQGARLGIRFLRGACERLRFGNATINLAGVDYQPMHSQYLVGAERMIRQDSVNVLLSHNPDVFPVAARQGWEVTIAGHTHGGQVNVEILRHDWNIARFFTPYTKGLYREAGSSIYVSRGIGTIGMPLRLGSVPEVALLKLCRT
ncbi:MAG TPA: metallophosphoesterase, partial [Bryobacteraceae bacterium]|nr:metallophosphoesterase [Bryobacteraceae bacterium]